MTHEEICGPNTLEVVYAENGMQQAVVRWCSKCGAVVVDDDYDGRTSPGAIMPMKFPSNR